MSQCELHNNGSAHQGLAICLAASCCSKSGLSKKPGDAHTVSSAELEVCAATAPVDVSAAAGGTPLHRGASPTQQPSGLLHPPTWVQLSGGLQSSLQDLQGWISVRNPPRGRAPLPARLQCQVRAHSVSTVAHQHSHVVGGKALRCLCHNGSLCANPRPAAMQHGVHQHGWLLVHRPAKEGFQKRSAAALLLKHAQAALRCWPCMNLS